VTKKKKTRKMRGGQKRWPTKYHETTGIVRKKDRKGVERKHKKKKLDQGEKRVARARTSQQWCVWGQGEIAGGSQ